MSDLISRQAALNAVRRTPYHDLIKENMVVLLMNLPSAEPEDSIPISWIEKEIDWLNSTDNYFLKLTTTNISAMVKKWKEEHE